MRAVILFLVLLPFAAVAVADDAAFDGPVFDTHMHYSSSAWAAYSPRDALTMMDKANVARALVSSTPDDGTSTLLAAAPGRMVSGLRPYRTSTEIRGWFKNPELLAYSKERLAKRRHVAFGEVILNYVQDLETPEMAEYLKLAAEQNLVLHFHTGAEVIDALIKGRPGLRVLWAHAGFNEPASVVGRMLDQYPNLWAGLSYRANDIMGGDDLEPEWRELLMRHSGRFTIGSDTWQNERWQFYQYLIDQHREWLGKLPKPVAEKIAFGNAAGLFGGR